jgi:hypothetical protein
MLVPAAVEKKLREAMARLLADDPTAQRRRVVGGKRGARCGSPPCLLPVPGRGDCAEAGVSTVGW